MKDEFLSMEDYWQKKLVDERKFYEEQLKTSENQFKDLEVKMKEYDEELKCLEINTSVDKNQLSTIDERISMEYQVVLTFDFIPVAQDHISRYKSGKKK